LHRVCLNPFWSLDAIAFIMAASVFYQNEMKLLEGRPAATTPPKSALTPFGSYCSGGMPGLGGVQRGEGTAGGVGIPCAVLPTDRVQSFDLDY